MTCPSFPCSDPSVLQYSCPGSANAFLFFHSPPRSNSCFTARLALFRIVPLAATHASVTIFLFTGSEALIPHVLLLRIAYFLVTLSRVSRFCNYFISPTPSPTIVSPPVPQCFTCFDPRALRFLVPSHPLHRISFSGVMDFSFSGSEALIPHVFVDAGRIFLSLLALSQPFCADYFISYTALKPLSRRLFRSVSLVSTHAPFDSWFRAIHCIDILFLA